MEVVGEGDDAEETDSTVIQQEFENEPFAIGSRGLHGCTMVTIVSTRAVYVVSPMRSSCRFPLSLVADFFVLCRVIFGKFPAG